MRDPRRLIGTFLAATVLVDLGAMAACDRESREVTAVGAVFWALCLSQISMAAIWTTLGGSHSARRILGALLILMSWSVAISWGRLGGDFRLAIVAVGAVFTAVGAPLLVIRPIGVRIVHLAEIGDGPFGLHAAQRLQFTIRYPLGLMTALALVLGIGKWLYLHDLWPGLLEDSGFLWMCTWRGAVAWAAMWAALGNRWIAMRLATLVLAAAASYSTLLLSSNSAFWGNWIELLLFSLEALLLLGSLWVFRVAGYRVGIWKTQNEDVGTKSGSRRHSERSEKSVVRP